MKVVTVVGARPQFIKAAVVSRAFAKQKNIKEKIIHTGQHFDANMSDVFFNEMQIPKPHFHLNISNLTHGAMTGRMLEGIENILVTEKPDYLLVYGDTNSTLAGALAATKLRIKVAHVEAGLRSFNMQMPEEINRILTDRISNVLFCPTNQSVKNLDAEGFNNFDCTIVNCGDVMLDAALYYSKFSVKKSAIINKIAGNDFVLCTIHRAENTDDINRLKSIIAALNEISETRQVIMPLHPRTKKIISSANIKTNFLVIDPVGYFDMIELLKHTSLVMTDSGGLQKEAFFFKKKCVTLRTETEWVELVKGGYNIISGYKKVDILKTYRNAVTKRVNFSQALYGTGNAGDKIARFLLKNS